MASRNVRPDLSSIAAAPVASPRAFRIVLQPLSHPGLDEIRIDDNLFAIGRTEPPFASYDPKIVADLSRRHARIFSEFGAVHIADLASKNGTTVNGIAIRNKPGQLNDGDEVCFARSLSFRVHLDAQPMMPAHAARLVSLTLIPEHDTPELQPIVIERFPFLISKSNAGFAPYKEKYPRQINYISRRHAHVFLKNGQPFVEDLGSTNGTFVDGKRLDEHAVPLRDGHLLAFGGHQLVYRVSLQKEAITDPTATRLSLVGTGAAIASGEADKTTFLAAADSFLDIFCVDRAQQEEDEPNNDVADSATPESNAETHGRRHKWLVLLAELKEAFADRETGKPRHAVQWGALLAAGLAALAFGFYLKGAPIREARELLARGDYAQAATATGDALARAPDSQELKALNVEAVLKANVPDWQTMLGVGNFGGASAIVARMKELAAHNAELAPLALELELTGALEKFVAERGNGEAPIRIFVDEERIAALLKPWDSDPQGHQRAFTAIASHVPGFKETYAEALSHLRKLQSDEAVYLAAIERLKTTIHTALSGEHPETLDTVFAEYAEKYPRLGGMDALREDLRQYIALGQGVRTRRLGPLVAQAANLKLSTPPFRERLQALVGSGQLPNAEVVAQYRAVSSAWRQGNTEQAIDGLRKMEAGAWTDAARQEKEHKQAIAEQFAELKKVRGSKAYDERLPAFDAMLDPAEDVYFIDAISADLDRREK